MAYKLKEQKIIPGGLNLLAPGDQVAEGDCLNLDDWFAGAAGRLEQAPNATLVNSPAVVTVQDSLCKVDSRVYYGGGGNLRQIGRIADAPIDSGYDGEPLGMISYQGSVWVMNRSKQRKDDGTTVTDWTPAPPSAAVLEDGGVNGGALSPAVGNPPEVGGLLAHEYKYFITYNSPLGETNPSAEAAITPAVDGSIVRVNQPGAAPAWVTGWNIYRRSPTFAAPLRVNENVLDISRDYMDDYGDEVHTHSDTQLLRLGIILEANHDAAPPARVLANQIYNGRILAANSADHPNRIWATPSLQPAFFRGSANENGGDWVDIGTDKGDEILAIAVKPGRVIIYRSRSIWQHVGDFFTDSARIEPLVPDIGIVGLRAMVSTSLGDYAIWNDGVYRITDWGQKVSAKVEPLFRGLAVEALTQLGTAHRSQMAIGYKNGRLWVSYPNSSGTMTGSLIWDVATDRWFNTTRAYNAFLDAGSDFLGAGVGVDSIEHDYTTGALVMNFQSAYIDCDQPDNQKVFAELVIHHNTRGEDLDVSVKLNKGATTVALTTINSTSLTREVIPIVDGADEPILAYNLSVLISGLGGTGEPTIIDSPMILRYYPRAHQGRSFDSAETDHGIESVKVVDQVEIDGEGSSTTSLQVYSDNPGGALTEREGSGIAIAAFDGRQVKQIVLTNAADGRLLRYRITGPGEFQVYGVRARVLPIGVYLDGSVGDFWQPQPLSIGV